MRVWILGIPELLSSEKLPSNLALTMRLDKGLLRLGRTEKKWNEKIKHNRQ
jgi:hypothetical protein